MIKALFILGNHIQALGLARQAHSIGLDVVLFVNDKYSITRFSNTVRKTNVFRNEEELIEIILKEGGGVKETLLFPTNDVMVDFLRRNYDFLSEKFVLGIPSPSTVDLFYNKGNTYRFATQNSISIPETWYPETLEDIEILSLELPYPVILKPAVMHSFHRIFGKKAYRCNNAGELVSKAKEIAVQFPIKEILIQEFLAGGAKTLYSYGVFAFNGKAIAALMANRIRQNPMEFGNSTTFAISCNVPQIQLDAEKLLKITNYTGLAEIEFMYDEVTGKYKFLEINTRAWKWHSISLGLGFGFMSKMINYMNGVDTSIEKDFTKKVAWVERLTDFFVIAKARLKGMKIVKDAVLSYRHKKVYAVWSAKDFMPFVMYIIMTPILYFKRH